MGGEREQGCDLNFPYVGEQILNAGNNACAPLKLEDPVVRLIGDGGERGKRFLIRTSRTLLLRLTFLSFVAAITSLRCFFGNRSCSKMCSYLSRFPQTTLYTTLNPASCQE